jgi:bifunctional NMN adenylyltransferase/nudix hydrolase
MTKHIDIQKVIDPSNYDVGVIVARFQLHKLHEGQKEMIDFVLSHHKKVILFLGIARAEGSKNNPLDFATRQAMIQADYPKLVVMPLQDQKHDTVWSNILDQQISMPFGEKKALLYGSRDSFLPHYTGRHATTELTSNIDMSATQVRLEVSKEILESEDFRAGIIHGSYAQRAKMYPTVDICAYNDKGQILMAKKPNEFKWRFVGGFVDPSDENLEHSARREFMEETNGSPITNLKYIMSARVNDWRYKSEDSKIMTTLFLGRLAWGRPEASDDIAEVKWFDVSHFTNLRNIKRDVVTGHQNMLSTLITKIYEGKLIPNIGEFHKKTVEVIDPDAVVKDDKYTVK